MPASTPLISTNPSKPGLLDDAVFGSAQVATDRWNWNWSRQAGTTRPAHYYEASLSPWVTRPALAGDRSCEVLVIGGGLLGAATALHLAEAGIDTVLVDKHHVGSAASGRNGGQLTPGLARWEASHLLQAFGQADAARLWHFAATEAMDLIDTIGARYGLDFERKNGHLTAAIHPGHLPALEEELEARQRLGDTQARLIDAAELQTLVRSKLYHGGVFDALGGQLHPLALLRGLIYALDRQGGAIFENTEVLGLQQRGLATLAATPGGTITARKAVVVAVHAASQDFLPTLRTTLPLYTYVGVSAPLGDAVAEFLPGGLPLYDTQFQIDYYRPVRHQRILFGGQGSGRNWSPQRVEAYLQGRFHAVFPELGKVMLDYLWSGLTDFTLNGAVDSRKMEQSVPLYLVHGWSGHGVAQTVRIGKAIADDIGGHNDDFARLTRIRHRSIPAARLLAPMAIGLAKASATVIHAIDPGRLISF